MRRDQFARELRVRAAALRKIARAHDPEDDDARIAEDLARVAEDLELRARRFEMASL